MSKAESAFRKQVTGPEIANLIISLEYWYQWHKTGFRQEQKKRAGALKHLHWLRRHVCGGESYKSIGKEVGLSSSRTRQLLYKSYRYAHRVRGIIENEQRYAK